MDECLVACGGSGVVGGLAGEFGDDLDAGAGSDAGGSGVEHGGGVGEGADAAGGFDAGAGSGYSAEEGDVVGGGSAGGEAGAGLEEVGSGGEGDLGGAEFFFEGEEAGFEDDFDDGALGVGEFDDAADVLADGFVVGGLAGFEEADVEDHVDVVCAVLEDANGFVALGGGEGGTQGEADDDADGDAGAVEGSGGEGDPGGVDHGAGEAVLGGLVAELEDLSAGGVGLEEGVVEDGGEVLRGGECVGGEGGGVEVFGSVRKGIGDGQRVQNRCSFGEGNESPRYFLSYRGKDWLKRDTPYPVKCVQSIHSLRVGRILLGPGRGVEIPIEKLRGEKVSVPEGPLCQVSLPSFYWMCGVAAWTPLCRTSSRVAGRSQSRFCRFDSNLR